MPARLNETPSSAAITTVESLVEIDRRKQVLAVSLLLAGNIVSLLPNVARTSSTWAAPGQAGPDIPILPQNPLSMRRADSQLQWLSPAGRNRTNVRTGASSSARRQNRVFTEASGR
jgi:hypothetical protein